jgi:peptide/nickel transport system substrate-binding protein
MRGRLLMLVLGGACHQDVAPPPGTLVISKEQTASWVRNFNPLLVTGSPRWPSRGGIYEPLLIYNVVTSQYTPWLAESWSWEADGTELVFTLREGVRWSDGAAFDAEDVVFTFELLRAHGALDAAGVWTRVQEVRSTGPHQVSFYFSEPHTPTLSDIAHQPVVAEHVWRDVDDPIRFTNPDPVGTGPFTQVIRFDSQVWELGRNPEYWQDLEVEVLRFPALPTNDQANLALIRGEVDWAGNFVPAVDRIFVSRDPQHHHYWFPLTGGTVFVYPNTTLPGLDDVRVRKAISMAIDRDLVVRVAMYGYSKPSRVTGLSDSYEAWRDKAVERSATWTAYAPEQAAALLDAAGLKRGPDGWRRMPDGQPIQWTIEVVAGWSDWVRAAQVTTANLREVGLNVRLTSRDFGAWYERLTRGDFELSLAWSNEGPTPFRFYGGLMSARGVKPIGESASSVWSRHGSTAMDQVLDAFAATADPEEQRRLVSLMQQIFVDEVPAVPLFPNPSWGAYNDTRFTGWPSEDNPYARLSPNTEPDPLLVFPRLRAR